MQPKHESMEDTQGFFELAVFQSLRRYFFVFSGKKISSDGDESGGRFGRRTGIRNKNFCAVNTDQCC